jgi:hypothetical protein
MINGVVKRVSEKEYNGKMLYSLQVNGDNTYYGCGYKSPAAQVGQSVSFDVSMNGKYANLVHESLQVLNDGKVEQAPSVAPYARKPFFNKGTKDAAKDTYWTDKEQRDIINSKRIEVQACRNTAIQFLGLLYTHGALSIPSAQAKKEAAVAAALEHYTQMFLAENEARVNPQAESPTDATKSVDSDDSDWEKL